MSVAIHVLIVEDESIVAMDLAAGLERDGYTVVGIADHFEEALDIYQNNSVDIVLMDINIDGKKDGVETAAALMQIRTVPLIYLTAFTDAQTIARVKETHASAFLSKPYSIDNVRIAMELALHNFAEARTSPNKGKVLPLQTTAEKKTDKEQLLQLDDHLFIKQQYRFVKIKLSEIAYAEADNNYVHVHTLQQKFTLRLSLADVIERLHFTRLVRIHRSYAVNIDAIHSFDEQLVRIGDKELPIGRQFREEFLQYFNWR